MHYQLSHDLPSEEEADFQELSAVDQYRQGYPAPGQYDDFVNYLRDSGWITDQRLAETREIINRIGRGDYTLDEIREPRG